MKVLAIADIHGHLNPLRSILNEVGSVDYVLIAGDISHNPSSLGSEVLKALDEWCASKGCLAFAVPGNADPPEIIGFRGSNLKIIHKSALPLQQYVLAGVGGGTGFEFWSVAKLNDTHIASFVDELLSKYGAGFLPYRWILLTHTPPYGTRCDVLYTGTHAGSKALRKLVEIRKPLLTVSGHIHESRGIDAVGKSVVVNPGPAYRRFYAVVMLDGMRVHAELLRAKPIN